MRDDDRAALLSRWLVLTRSVLPGMAAAHRWPIQHDHCFMRVCLDVGLGMRWDRLVARPAIRHLNADQLARVVAVAEDVVAAPASLPELNRRSLALRGKTGETGS